MAILKCKMCGGDLQINDNQNCATCEYCGSTMTLPRASDERKVNLFNRANHFRRMNDFDKTLTIYENILNDDDTDAEAHWGVVLCRYGIEYVEDPLSHERIPTCHRAQYDSILSDADYLASLENAPDGYSRSLYEAEAKRISEIQKEILSISKKEEPFDVFICYKESSESGTRTKDSAIAQDIYYQLTQAGYKVFFSRITLEDKLGRAYEPYIFAALNSAKVMVVVGTSMENFNAVWVKNEWNRYLALTKKDRSKLIIPCYRDMDAYELPEELSYLQSQDMGKIGFIQDLIRGIKKVISTGQMNPAMTQQISEFGYVPSEKPLLERAFLCLEDGEFDKADVLLEQVLNMNPHQAKAYIGKLMVELKVCLEPNIMQCMKPLTEFNAFNKAIRFADVDYRSELQNYNNMLIDRIEQEAIKRKQQAENATEWKRNEFVDESEQAERIYEDKITLLSKLTNEKKALSNEIDTLKKSIEESNNSVSYKENTISFTQSSISEIESRKSIFRKESASETADIVAYKNKIDKERNEIKNLQTIIAEKKTRIVMLKSKYDELSAQSKKIANEIKALRNEYGIKTSVFDFEEHSGKIRLLENAGEIYKYLCDLNSTGVIVDETILSEVLKLVNIEKKWGNTKSATLLKLKKITEL